MTALTPDATHLKESQLDEAAQVLRRAFFDDPLMEFVLPDEERRQKPLEWFMRAGLRLGQLYGEVHTTPESVDGAACWLPPGQTDVSPIRMARAGMLIAPFKLGLSSFGRLLTIMNHLEELHKRDVPEDHWYLMALGVDTEKQGQGIGGSIIQPVLRRADEERLPCYLETMTERNVVFYERHGFRVIVEDHLPKGGPRFWTMKRSPGP